MEKLEKKSRKKFSDEFRHLILILMTRLIREMTENNWIFKNLTETEKVQEIFQLFLSLNLGKKMTEIIGK